MLCVLAIVLASVLVVQRPSGAALQAPHLVIPASPVQPGGIAFDPITGDLFGTQPFSNSVFVIPKTSGTIFGQHVSANVEVTLDAATGLDSPADVVFDPQGNLYISNAGFSDSITVIGRSDTTVFGQSVSANVAVSLTAANNKITPVGMAFDSHGNLFVEGQNSDGWLSVVAAADGNLADGESTDATTRRVRDESGEPAGCGCRVAGRRSTGAARDDAWWALGLIALVVARRRARRATPGIGSVSR
jgi:DNA-binding beta-propeller fold protein YncE